ncbi:(2Fe-2S)-binding protein [Aestuariibacter sp. AA17]|uniref:(2Fe-2S)-binding protein n=1 Tax=Fluctibacter corallii TaxID=2984329 RepID=A0ABT3A734_9ALTE|nr:(2Fe-2S)-binding protein [Aestuariibacter sp. AA17]MCV2884508.1 (2Fe-2S)-binding protein [Aestuariibacter sp. AA17]
MVSFVLNGNPVESSAEDDTSLLWVIRDELGLKGTKYGCGIAMCGACTVHIDGLAVRSCSYPVKQAEGKTITTIEGLGNQHPLQQAWIDEQVPQCGYCQSGQIMQAATLLKHYPSPSDEQITTHMNGNLCRCMAYHRIKKAIKRAASQSDTVDTSNGVNHYIPDDSPSAQSDMVNKEISE